MIFYVLPRLLGLALLFAEVSVAAAEPVLLPLTVGAPSATRVQPGDTLLDIAFRHAIGFSHLHRLNPDIDVWIPGGLHVAAQRTAAQPTAGEDAVRGVVVDGVIVPPLFVNKE